MGKYGESFGKKEKEKKRLQIRNEKAEKMADRKASTQKGKPLEDMMAYLDENGNLSSTPPDQSRRRMFNQEEIQIGVPKQEDRPQPAPRSGMVSYFMESKGFGFINDLNDSQVRIFFHKSQFPGIVKEGMKVSFEVESGPRGLHAIHVKKIG